MNKFEEYKLFVEDTAKFSERRQKITNIYLTTNSILITAMAFIVKDAGFYSLWEAIIILLLLITGVSICMLWRKLIYSYKSLVDFRIKHLRKIEDHKDMEDCHRMYHQEDELYPRDSEEETLKGKALNISVKESWLPIIFTIIYVIFFIGGIYNVLFYNN
jgi:ABC-type nickel/cobalt efflux system permease component RcnA